MNMELNVNLIKIIETVVVVVFFIMGNLLSKRWIKSLLKKINFSLQRRRLTLKMINLLLLIFSSVFIAAIWGVK